MNAIIFLAPISSFDERLREDRRVNRLEDTYMLWQTLCSLQMLSKTQIILFLNKCDLLEQKLRAGVRVRTHVPSFGNRSNDVDTVKKCQSGALLFFPRGVSSRTAPANISPIVDFQSHFKEIAKQHSPEPRRFYVHLTSVIVRFSGGATNHRVIIVFLVTGNTGHCCHTANSRRRYLTCKPPTCGSSLVYIITVSLALLPTRLCFFLSICILPFAFILVFSLLCYPMLPSISYGRDAELDLHVY